MAKVAVSCNDVHEESVWTAAGVESRKHSVALASHTGVCVAGLCAKSAGDVAVWNRVAVSGGSVPDVPWSAGAGSVCLSYRVVLACQTAACLVVLARSAAHEAAPASTSVEVGSIEAAALTVHPEKSPVDALSTPVLQVIHAISAAGVAGLAVPGGVHHSSGRAEALFSNGPS